MRTLRIAIGALFSLVLAAGCSSSVPSLQTSPQMGMPKSTSPGLIHAAPMAKTAIQPSSEMASRVSTQSDVQGANFTQLSGSATQVAAAPDGSLWALATAPSGVNKYIWHYVNGSWTNISGLAMRISVGPSGTLYATNSGGGVYAYSGGTWTGLGGGTTDVTAASDGSIYVLSNGSAAGSNQAIWHYAGGIWTQVPGQGVTIAASWDTHSYALSNGVVSADGLYIVNAGGNIYHENTNNSFVQLPGAASSVAPTTLGGFYALGNSGSPSGNALYYYNLSTPGYSVQSGAGVAISTDSVHLYVVGTSSAIYSSPVVALAPPANLTLLPASGSSGVSVYTNPNTGNTYMLVPTAGGLLQMTVGQGSALAAAAAVKPFMLAGTGPLSACDVDKVNLVAYCISNGTVNPGVIQEVSLSSTPALTGTITTDATTTSSFSGEVCYLCGVVWDATDTRVIVADSHGYELYNPATKALATTIAAPPSENFGYNATTDQIFSPHYDSYTNVAPNIDLADIAGKVDYTLASPVLMASSSSEPDGGAVDSSTNVAVAADEAGNGVPFYTLPLGSASFTKGSGTTPSTFKDPGAATSSIAQTVTTACSVCEETGIAIDPASHLAFLGAEFSYPQADYVGVAQLPSSAPASGASVAISNYVFAALPNTPDGNTFAAGHDPHPVYVFYLPGNSETFGATYNDTQNYVAVLNLTQLLVAPATSNLVNASYNLQTNGILTYFGTSYMAPASVARRRAQHVFY